VVQVSWKDGVETMAPDELSCDSNSVKVMFCGDVSVAATTLQ
jgi:hypothetical protein